MGNAPGDPRPRRLPWVVGLLALVAVSLGYLQWQSSLDGVLRADTATGPAAGEARSEDGLLSLVLSVRGRVEYRRGEQGSWREARSGVRLTWGDWINSADGGTAEIRLPSGSIYVLPAGTLARLDQLAAHQPGRAGSAPAEDVDFSWIEFETAEVSSSTRSRPTGPRLVGPAREHEIDLATQQQLRLDWEKVPAASRYTLNVSASDSFAANIIEDSRRLKPSAKIGIRAEGVFYWRVAAVDRDGLQGGWSEVRSFRVRG